jgi:retron-type reverse transcriptase
MKPLANIFDDVVSLDNLFASAKKALVHGRRFKGEGAIFKFNLEREIFRLHRQLAEKKYRHGKYRLFTIRDPKERAIAAAPLRDRVLHHAVHDVVEPLLDRIFIFDSYACRKGKGTHRALDRAHHFLRANQYAVHLDVKNYFQSIDHGILKRLLRRFVADTGVYELIEEIIDSTDYLAVNRYSPAGRRRISNVATVDEQPALPGLGTGSAGGTGIRGVPLGNLTSQFFANLYLNELDQFVKHELKVRGYVRYMDDMLLFSNDKVVLRKWEESVREFAERKLKLELHPTSGPQPVAAGVSFLGFRLFPAYRKLKRTSVSRFIRRMNGYAADYVAPGKNDEERTAVWGQMNISARSFNAHALNGNTYKIRKTLYDRFPLIDQRGMAGMKQQGEPYAVAANC